MRKNFGAKALMYPMPVLIVAAYDENGKANAMNAAWGGIGDYTQITICISEGHKTTQNIFSKKAFTVSMADAEHVVEADYLGIVSGHKEPDKMEKAGLHTTKSQFVDAPLIDEFPMALECEFVSYNRESGLLIGEIVNVSADEKVLDDNGKIDPAKLQPITYDPMNHVYLKLGEKVGNAFSDGKKIK